MRRNIHLRTLARIPVQAVGELQCKFCQERLPRFKTIEHDKVCAEQARHFHRRG